MMDLKLRTVMEKCLVTTITNEAADLTRKALKVLFPLAQEVDDHRSTGLNCNGEVISISFARDIYIGSERDFQRLTVTVEAHQLAHEYCRFTTLKKLPSDIKKAVKQEFMRRRITELDTISIVFGEKRKERSQYPDDESWSDDPSDVKCKNYEAIHFTVFVSLKPTS